MLTPDLPAPRTPSGTTSPRSQPVLRSLTAYDHQRTVRVRHLGVTHRQVWGVTLMAGQGQGVIIVERRSPDTTRNHLKGTCR